MKKELVTNFFLSSVTNLRGQSVRLHEFFWTLFRSYKINSVTPKRLLKKQFFFEKNQPFQWKKPINRFFSSYRVWEASWMFLEGSTWYSDNDCASCKVLSATPKRLLKTQTFLKKGILSSEKNIMEYFPRSIEHEKCRDQLIGVQNNFWKKLWKTCLFFYRT